MDTGARDSDTSMRRHVPSSAGRPPGNGQAGSRLAHHQHSEGPELSQKHLQAHTQGGGCCLLKPLRQCSQRRGQARRSRPARSGRHCAAGEVPGGARLGEGQHTAGDARLLQGCVGLQGAAHAINLVGFQAARREALLGDGRRRTRGSAAGTHVRHAGMQAAWLAWQ